MATAQRARSSVTAFKDVNLCKQYGSLLFGSAFSMQRLDGQSDALAAADAQRD